MYLLYYTKITVIFFIFRFLFSLLAFLFLRSNSSNPPKLHNYKIFIYAVFVMIYKITEWIIFLIEYLSQHFCLSQTVIKALSMTTFKISFRTLLVFHYRQCESNPNFGKFVFILACNNLCFTLFTYIVNLILLKIVLCNLKKITLK